MKRREKTSARQLIDLHGMLCFRRAFPASSNEFKESVKQLAAFSARVAGLSKAERLKLVDSGIAGTDLHYRFSLPVSKWLARMAPGAISIDWSAVENEELIDDLLGCFLEPSEDEFFDSGYASAREWLELAQSHTTGTDFDWLLAQFRRMPAASTSHHLFEATDLPLTLDLGQCKLSKSQNAMSVRKVHTRELGMRRCSGNVKKEIQRPFDAVPLVSRQRGTALLDAAMASLAVRHRETNHFNFANAAEVYEFDVGEGVTIAVFGLGPEHRYPIECTMGFLILSNGAPIGYGGSSSLFRQANTGINIFDEYRGSEASYLWVQVMRVFHYLTACTRFIANPYQFGAENNEALRSGAFWFYYRLGFRPVRSEIRAMAAREKKRKDAGRRSDLKMLRELASCDMHLCLSSARKSEFFEEDWLVTSSKLATAAIAETGLLNRDEAVNATKDRVAKELRIRSLRRWMPDERRAFKMMAPIVAAAKPENWSADAKCRMRSLLRAKGGPGETTYANLLAEHDEFRIALSRVCRASEAD